jgi:hypothetical protein
MKRLFKYAVVGLAICSTMVLASNGWAQDATTQPVGEVNIPWGGYVADAVTALAMLTVPVIGWLFRKLPAQWGSMLMAARVDQLLERSIDYGLNAVSDASRDKKLSVPVANDVLREAAQYAVDNAPNLVKLAGGTDLLIKKIIARLEVETSAAVSSGPAPLASLGSAPHFTDKA